MEKCGRKGVKEKKVAHLKDMKEKVKNLTNSET